MSANLMEVWVNTYGDDAVAIWIDGDCLRLRRESATIVIHALLNHGVPVKSYWDDCLDRERLIDGRIAGYARDHHDDDGC
jgi:hypothetical protein